MKQRKWFIWTCVTSRSNEDFCLFVHCRRLHCCWNISKVTAFDSWKSCLKDDTDMLMYFSVIAELGAFICQMVLKAHTEPSQCFISVKCVFSVVYWLERWSRMGPSLNPWPATNYYYLFLQVLQIFFYSKLETITAYWNICLFRVTRWHICSRLMRFYTTIYFSKTGM